MRLTPWTLALLAACGDGGKIDLDDTGSPDTATSDTGSDGDADTDTDSDTDADTDSDTGSGGNLTTVTFHFDADTTGTALTLTPILPTDASLGIGDLWLSGLPTGDTLTIQLPDPAPGLLVEIDPKNLPGLYISYFVPALHTDPDTDGEPEADEAYVGVDATWLLFVDGAIPVDLAAFGIRPGWNAVADPLSAATMGDLTDIPFSVNLLPQESVTLSGTYAGDLDLRGLRLTATAFAALKGGAPGWAADFDQPLDTAWTATWSGPPDDSALIDVSGSGLLADPELLYAYSDLDHSGSQTEGDLAAYGACYDATATGALWIAPPTDLENAVSLGLYGLSTGWVPVAFTDDLRVLTPEEAASTVLDGTCSLD